LARFGSRWLDCCATAVATSSIIAIFPATFISLLH
jgi:hypothetical protein